MCSFKGDVMKKLLLGALVALLIGTGGCTKRPDLTGKVEELEKRSLEQSGEIQALKKRLSDAEVKAEAARKDTAERLKALEESYEKQVKCLRACPVKKPAAKLSAKAEPKKRVAKKDAPKPAKPAQATQTAPAMVRRAPAPVVILPRGVPPVILCKESFPC
jgi:hypothetical protein